MTATSEVCLTSQYNVSKFFFLTFYWKFYFFCSLSNMFSTIFSIVFATVLVSVESSSVQSAFEVAMRCTKKGWQAGMDDLASSPVTKEDILEKACTYLRVSITEYLYITSTVYISLSCGLSFSSSKEGQQQKIKTLDGAGTYSQWTRRGGNWEAVRGSEWIWGLTADG